MRSRNYHSRKDDTQPRSKTFKTASSWYPAFLDATVNAPPEGDKDPRRHIYKFLQIPLRQIIYEVSPTICRQRSDTKAWIESSNQIAPSLNEGKLNTYTTFRQAEQLVSGELAGTSSPREPYLNTNGNQHNFILSFVTFRRELIFSLALIHCILELQAYISRNASFVCDSNT